MSPSLRIPLKTSTGLFLGEDELLVTTYASGPFGRRRVSQATEPVLHGDVAGALRELARKGMLKGRVVCGVDARRSYSITMPASADDTVGRPSDLAAHRLGFKEGNLVAEMRSLRLPAGRFTHLSAAFRNDAEVIMSALADELPPKIVLVPLPWALYQSARGLAKGRRRTRTDMHVLTGPRWGIALLGHRGAMLAARRFVIPARDDGTAAALATTSLLEYARDQLNLPGIDSIFLHCGDDRAGIPPALSRVSPIPVEPAPLLTTEPESLSAALATTGLHSSPPAPDLIDEVRPARTTGSGILRTLGLITILLFCTAWALLEQIDAQNRQIVAVNQQLIKNTDRAGIAPGDLAKVHAAWKREVELARAFFEDRVFWSDVLLEVASTVPETMTLVRLEGRDSIRFPGKGRGTIGDSKGAKRLLRLIGEVDAGTLGAAPPEVSELTENLQAMPTIAGAFPRLTGATMRLVGRGPKGSIEVVCLGSKDS
jgi:hypothetical protein